MLSKQIYEYLESTKNEMNAKKQDEFDKLKVLRSIIRIIKAIARNDPMYYSLDLYKLYQLFDSQSPVGTYVNFFKICHFYKVLGLFGYKQLAVNPEYMKYLSFSSISQDNNNNTTIFVLSSPAPNKSSLRHAVSTLKECIQSIGYKDIMSLSYSLNSTNTVPKDTASQFLVT